MYCNYGELDLARMESRKVQKVGPSTFSVSIPRPWADEMALRRGDTVFITQEKDGSLRLFPNKPPSSTRRSTGRFVRSIRTPFSIRR